MPYNLYTRSSVGSNFNYNKGRPDVYDGLGSILNVGYNLLSSLYKKVLKPVAKESAKIIKPATKALLRGIVPFSKKAAKVSMPLYRLSRDKVVKPFGSLVWNKVMLPISKKVVYATGDFRVTGKVLSYYRKGYLPQIIDSYGIIAIGPKCFCDVKETDLYITSGSTPLTILANAFEDSNIFRVHLGDDVIFNKSSFNGSGIKLVVEGENIYNKLIYCKKNKIPADFTVWINNPSLTKEPREKCLEYIKSYLFKTGADKFIKKFPENIYYVKMIQDNVVTRKNSGILGIVSSYHFVPQNQRDKVREEILHDYLYAIRLESRCGVEEDILKTVSEKYNQLKFIAIYEDEDTNRFYWLDKNDNEFSLADATNLPDTAKRNITVSKAVKAYDDSLKSIDKPIVFKDSGDKLDTMKAANQKIDTPPKKISEIKIDNSKIDKRIVESKSLSGQQIKSQCKNVAEVKSDPGMSNIFR